MKKYNILDQPILKISNSNLELISPAPLQRQSWVRTRLSLIGQPSNLPSPTHVLFFIIITLCPFPYKETLNELLKAQNWGLDRNELNYLTIFKNPLSTSFREVQLLTDRVAVKEKSLFTSRCYEKRHRK